MITYQLEAGGSGNGITNALKRMRCPRMGWYASQEESTPSLGSNGALCGTIFHAFCEIYALQEEWFDPEDVEFIPPAGMTMPLDFPVEFLEACRMFTAYRAKYSHHLGGTLLGAEIQLELDGLTAKMDAVIENPRELNLSGTWIVDYKCLSKFGASDQISYEWSAQAAWYRRIYEHHRGPIDGVVFLVAVKTKIPRFEVVVAKPWSPSVLQILEDKMREIPSQERTFQCSNQYGTCKYITKCLGE